MEFSVTGTDETRVLETGLVLTSIGYRGKPIRDLPYDESSAVVPNDGGRVVDPASGEPVPGAYVAGWIKRGPSGFIGTNKSCSFQTVQALVADFNAGKLTDPVAKPDGAGPAGARPPSRRDRRRGMARHRRRRNRARQPTTADRATSSPMSPPCSRPQPPRSRRRHRDAGCWIGCSASRLPARTSPPRSPPC